MESIGINIWSTLLAAIASFIIGAIWYGPLFGKAWLKEKKLTNQELSKRSVSKIFGISLILQLIIATNLSVILHGLSIHEGILYSLWVSICLVATVLGIIYLFSRNSLKLWFIDALYFIVVFVIMSIIITAWP